MDPISRSLLQDIGFRFSRELFRTRVGKLHHSSSIARSYRCSSEGQAESQGLNRPATGTGFTTIRREGALLTQQLVVSGETPITAFDPRK